MNISKLQEIVDGRGNWCAEETGPWGHKELDTN